MTLFFFLPNHNLTITFFFTWSTKANMSKHSTPAQLQNSTMTGMRTQAADGITKPKVDPLNSEAPRVRPQESITKHNNHSEGAKISCRANGKANKSAVNMGNPVGPEKTRTAKCHQPSPAPQCRAFLLFKTMPHLSKSVNSELAMMYTYFFLL